MTTNNIITQKIVGYRVKADSIEQPEIEIYKSIMHEGIKRHDILDSRTYKIKIPSSEHAVYVTIGHIDINGVIHPYELFINCKNPDHQQWISALTRLISAVLRKGGDVRFIATELMQVFDANGGHWTKKGANGEKPRFMASLIAEIGLCLEKHFDYIDLLNNSESNQKQPALIEKEKVMPIDEEEVIYPKNAEICPSCKQKSALRLDGCLTCVNGDCNYSKCG
jgi:hypothetical protein